MTDKATAADLVTETPPVIPKGATQVHPAAHLDPAAALDPGKVTPAKKKPAAKKRKSMAKRIAAMAASARAKDVKSEAASNHASAKQEHDRAANDELRAAYDATLHHQVDQFAALEGDDFTIRLAGDGHFVSGEIAATRADFVPGHFGVTFTRPLDIGPDGDPVRVDEVWLIAEAGDAVRCEVGPIAGGGGFHAQIPANSLKF